MGMMNWICTYLTKAAVLALSLCIISCSGVRDVPERTGMVSLTFRTRSGAEATGTFSEGELISHLRILIADRTTGRLLYNYSRALSREEESVTVTFSEIPVGVYDFYAIANEGSLGLAGLDGMTDVSWISSCTVRTDPDSFSSGVPASCRLENVAVTGDDMMRLTMSLEHIVAKVCVQIDNMTASPQSLSGLAISGIAGESVPLFPDGGYVPGTGSSLEIPDSRTASIPAYSSVEIVSYVYPTSAAAGGYSISADWNGTRYDSALTADDGTVLSSVGMNTQLNIGLDLYRGLEMTWTVSDWNTVESGIEFSDSFLFSLDGQNIKMADLDSDGVADCIVTALGTDTQQGERFVQFRFMMSSPLGRRWTAHLSDPVHFGFVDGYSGTGTDDAAEGTVTLTIAPRFTYRSGEEWSTELYFTVEGLDGPQLVNVEGRFPGTDDSILIRQISTVEYDSLN